MIYTLQTAGLLLDTAIYLRRFLRIQIAGLLLGPAIYLRRFCEYKLRDCFWVPQYICGLFC
jgi:hypothetical protein